MRADWMISMTDEEADRAAEGMDPEQLALALAMGFAPGLGARKLRELIQGGLVRVDARPMRVEGEFHGKNNGFTLAMRAVVGNNVEALAALVECGCDLGASNQDRRGAAHVAARLGREEALRLLLGAGCSLDAYSSVGRDVLEEARACGHAGCERLIREEMARRLARREAGDLGAVAPEPGRSKAGPAL